MARIDNLSNFLSDVAEAIRTKKGTTDTIPASNFDTEITSIEGGSSKYAPRYISFYKYTGTELDEEIANLDTSNINYMNHMFYNCSNIKSLDLSNFNTSSVTDMNNMFANCGVLPSLNLSSFNTSKVKNLNGMFDSCQRLTTLNLSNFNTSSVTNMSRMFYNCSNLKSLDLSNFDTSSVTDMNNMFANCQGLTTLNLSNFNTSSVTNTGNMFNSCRGLTSLDLSGFDTSNATSMTQMFNNCEVLTDIKELNADKVINISTAFSSCGRLANFGGLKNLGKAYDTSSSANYYSYKLDLSYCYSLTEQSLINVLNNLYDIKTKGCKPQQVVLGSTNLAKLTSEAGQQSLAQAQQFGWNIS